MGWQDGAGVRVPIDDAALDCALCDAQHIGSLDGELPARAHQDITPAVERLVWRRDGGRCRADGCRSARGLQIHHIIHRAARGGHEPSNLVLLCGSCHLAHHRGLLAITGTSDHLEVHRPNTHPASIAGAHVGARTDGRVGARSLQSVAGTEGPIARDAGAHVGASGRGDWSPDAVANRGTPARAASIEGPVAGAHVGASGRSDCSPDAVANRGTPARARSIEGPVAGAHVGARERGEWSPDAVANRGTPARGASIEGPVAGAHGGAGVAAGGRLDVARLRTQAKDALVGLGWKPVIAQTAVAEAAVQCSETTLEKLIVEALRRCPVRKA